MTVSVDVLRQLHRIHRQLADVQGRLNRGPKIVRLSEQSVRQAEQELTEAKDLVRKTRMAVDEQQLQLRQREAKIVDLKRKLNECKTNTEYKLLGDQVAAELQANSVLEDEILERLERLDAAHAHVKEIQVKLDSARREFEKNRDRVDAERAMLEAEVARVTKELEESESSLPVDIRNEYQRIVRARGEGALAPVEGQTCSGCYTLLTTQTMSELMLSRLVFCKSCGCLLYLPEDRTVGTA